MVKYQIRPVVETDIPFLWEMLYLSIYIPEGEEPPGKDILKDPSISKYVEGWGRQGDAGFIAINSEGEPIGSITLKNT